MALLQLGHIAKGALWADLSRARFHNCKNGGALAFIHPLSALCSCILRRGGDVEIWARAWWVLAADFAYFLPEPAAAAGSG
jgi:hypothetical protein